MRTRQLKYICSSFEFDPLIQISHFRTQAHTHIGIRPYDQLPILGFRVLSSNLHKFVNVVHKLLEKIYHRQKLF